ncbi:MAG TPA: phosphatase PAP2 family protein [Actinomycetota bacterium]|nr:phosphatase PAP2 family protein [Actinomycetota bacterium]
MTKRTTGPSAAFDPRSRRPGPVGTGLLVSAALGLAAATVRGRGRVLDDRVFNLVNSEMEHPLLDRFFMGVTELGSLYASGAAGLTVLASGRRREALDALGAAAATWLIGQWLKQAWRRNRPFQSDIPFRLLIGKPRGTSWPSSHPMVLLAFVTVAGRNLRLGKPVRTGLNGLAGLVAASRVYLGVHYPADVAGGLLLGRAIADTWSRTVSPRAVG